MAGETPSGGTASGRVHRRVTAGLPMIVRGTDRNGVRFEDATHCFDVSRTGASFATARELEMGKNVEVVIALATGVGSGGRGDFNSLARIVRIAPGEEPPEFVVAVQFLEARFPRVFVSESTA